MKPTEPYYEEFYEDTRRSRMEPEAYKIDIKIDSGAHINLSATTTANKLQIPIREEKMPQYKSHT